MAATVDEGPRAMLHRVCFDTSSDHPFQAFSGKMFAQYLAFISELDRTDPINGEPVASFADALRNDRSAMLRGGMPESWHDGTDDYFWGKEQRFDVFDDLVVIPFCNASPARNGIDTSLSLVNRIFAGELIQISVKLFHLDDGKTGALIEPTQ